MSELIPILDKVVNFGIGFVIVCGSLFLVCFGVCITFFIKVFKEITRGGHDKWQ